MKQMLAYLTAWDLKQAYLAIEKELYGHVEIQSRLLRGYRILTESVEYEITVTSLTPYTFEFKGPNDTYTVIPDAMSCTCPDRETLCKHRLAAKLILRANEVYIFENSKRPR